MSNPLYPVAVVGPLPHQQRILAAKLGRHLATRLRFLNHQSGSLTVPESCRFAVAWVDFLSHRHVLQVVAQIGRGQTIQYTGGINGLVVELRSLMLMAV
jgi:hypothetical protein